MKVLFLDIDGVLNTPAAELGYRLAQAVDLHKYDEVTRKKLTNTWCPASLYNLYRIVEQTDCKIVISSTWRLNSDLKDMKGWFNCDLLKNAVLDKTPSILRKTGEVTKSGHEVTERAERGEEIAKWLEHCPEEITDFAIIDDDSDMLSVHDHFFQTDGFVGLDWRVANKVISFLNIESVK